MLFSAKWSDKKNMNSEVEWIRQKAAVANSELLSQHLPTTSAKKLQNNKSG